MPAGAVRGDIERQHHCGTTPHDWYVELTRTCVQCGGEFVFWAREQTYWYERLQFNLASTAIRCVDCRKRRRSERALGRSLADAVEAVAEAG